MCIFSSAKIVSYIPESSSSKNVILQGLDGYIVSEKNGQFIICQRCEEQRIKDFLVVEES